MTSVKSSARSEGSHRAAVALRVLWFGVIPLLLAGVTLRYLIPERGEGGAWGAAFAVAANSHRLGSALVLLLFYSALLGYWRRFLPGGRSLVVRRADLSARSVGLTLVATLAAGGAAWLLRATTAQTFTVEGVSMLPTLEPQDQIIAEKLAYRAAMPRRGDVVVLAGHGRAGGGPNESVKRVIGLPGDRVVVGDELRVNGFRVPTCDAGRYLRSVEGHIVDGRLVVEFLGKAAYLVLIHTGDRVPPPVERTVAPGELFVLGDDRDVSVDSRAWTAAGAPVRISDVVGGVRRILWREAWTSRSPLERLFRKVDASVRIEGIDTRELEAAVAACLAARPAQAEPPLPTHAVGPDAQAKR